MRHFLRGGGKLVLALFTLAVVAGLPLRSHAQRSPLYTGTTPFVEVGAGTHDGHFLSNADHFMYCPEGSDVTGIEVIFVSEFYTNSCNSRCTHPPRTVTWSVSGGNPTVLEKVDTLNQDTGQTSAHVKYLLKVSAGDTITATCTIGAASTATQCQERKQGGYYDHTGNHGGATATCTVKFWRADLTANVDIRPNYEYPHYACEFATNVTTTATVVGATAYEYKWASWINGSIHKSVTNTSNTWVGKLVDYTSIDCQIKVRNQCDLSQWDYAWPGIYIDATQRRPDWMMAISLDGQNLNWLSDKPDAFPQVNEAKWEPGGEYAYGQNTNFLEKYRGFSTIIVTPIYVHDQDPNPPELPDDYEAFEGTTGYIDSGPHEGFFFNDDPTLYAVKRYLLSNHWINPNPGVGHPSVPAKDKDNHDYTNWASLLQLNELGPGCKCLYPARHDGEGASAHYNANQRHETYGSPYQGSPPNWALGHQGLMQGAVENGYPDWYDAVWRCDLLYSATVNGLRISDEGARNFVNQKLLDQALLLHQNGYLGTQPDSHNYCGDLPVFTSGSGWGSSYTLF